MRSDGRRQVGFFTQAALIAVPLVILSAVALYSLRQDKASIEQDARDRAAILVSELAHQWSQHASKEFAELSTAQSLEFTLADKGHHADRSLEGLPQLQCFLSNDQIRSPVDYPRLPMPPDWVAARLPEAVLANAEFNMVLSGTGPLTPTQVERLTTLARRHPEALTESGTPLADLALIQALRLSPRGRLPDVLLPELFRRMTMHSSFLTPELLEALERASGSSGAAQRIQALKRLWLMQEKARSLLHLLLQRGAPRTQSQVWLDAEGESILALCQPFSSRDGKIPACQVTLLPWRVLQQMFVKALARARVEVPAYATAVVQIGERRWRVPSASQFPDREGQQRAPELAYASGQLEIQPAVLTSEPVRLSGLATSYPFRIGLELADQDLLYARYRQRLWFSAGLVLLAAAAAGLGLVIAWRAFQRQMKLAEMTSAFVSSVSHEFRAPLASVRLMAESLDQGRITGSEKRGEYIGLILQECRRLSSLVENVLDFSRIDQGRRQYEFEPFDLMAMVNQTIKLMGPSAAERQVTLILAGPPTGADELQPCWDAQAVQQALVNLIDNAIKHSSAGGAVKLTLELVQLNGDKTPDKILVSVQDQGRGIPAEEMKRIFDPFYRSGPELRRETKGIGIGLSIVKHVAEAHRGRVLVHSLVGEGSCFTLELPNSQREGNVRPNV